jgi:drug/metabolite transporter (DMT)-like permease
MPIEHLGLTGLMALEGFLGTLLVVAAYRLAPVVVVAPMQYGQIIWATIFGIYYFNEPMTIYTITGIGIIIASGLYIMLKSHWQQQAEAAKNVDAPQIS